MKKANNSSPSGSALNQFLVLFDTSFFQLLVRSAFPEGNPLKSLDGPQESLDAFRQSKSHFAIIEINLQIDLTFDFTQ